MANTNLHQAKRARRDEFYTRMEDIADQLYHYRHHFQGKSVFLNCDDPEESNFWKYFELNFEDLGLTRLVSTHYHATERTYKLVMEVDSDGKITTTKTPLEGNGDFRSAECLELLDEADIVVTNPPFSLFREYVAVLVEHAAKFVIIGPQNAITYKEIFPLLKDNKIWLGYPFKRGDAYFRIPKENAGDYSKGVYDPTTGLVHFRNCHWFTNLDIDKRHEPLTLWKDYDPNEYPKYDNYNAIEVSKVAEIPCDFYGVMGVPITFMDKYCPEQFEILDGRDHALHDKQKRKGTMLVKDADSAINGKPKYARILIRRVDQPDTTK